MAAPNEPRELNESLGELTFLGRDSVGGNCPSVFRTGRGSYVVQGWKIKDSEALARLKAEGMPDWEAAVEIPAGLVKYFDQGA